MFQAIQEMKDERDQAVNERDKAISERDKAVAKAGDEKKQMEAKLARYRELYGELD